MVEIKYSNGNPALDPNSKSGTTLSYHIDKKILSFLDKKVRERINHKDKDYVLLTDGYEGSGKSTFSMQIGRYIDPTLNLNRVCMTADEFKNAIIKAKKGQTVIYDEAVTGLSAAESITRIGRLLKSMMMQMRQKNLFVIVILPTVFELNRYSVLSRARSLFHIYESSGRMGYWVGYNKKDLRTLYMRGKKTYSYRVRSNFRGRFYGKYAVNEIDYRKKKEQALFRMDKEGYVDKINPFVEKYHKAIHIFKEYNKLSNEKMAEILKFNNLDVSRANIGVISRKMRQIATS